MSAVEIGQLALSRVRDAIEKAPRVESWVSKLAIVTSLLFRADVTRPDGRGLLRDGPRVIFMPTMSHCGGMPHPRARSAVDGAATEPENPRAYLG